MLVFLSMEMVDGLPEILVISLILMGRLVISLCM